MMYLGSPGRMIGLKCPVSQRVTADEGYRYVTTLEGKRKAQVVPGQRRVWDVSTGQITEPQQIATLMEFASGSWGPGPFWFVPEAAAQVNLMSPHDVMNAGDFPGGPMRLDDGSWSALSRADRGDGIIFWRDSGIPSDPPALPGEPVTASAYVEGVGGYVLLQFFDRVLGQVSSVRSGSSSTPTTGERLSVTGTAPSNAAYVRISVRDATRASRPAITWTRGVTEWGEGLGCPKAVISQADRSAVRAIPGVPVLSDLSFTVTEVG